MDPQRAFPHSRVHIHWRIGPTYNSPAQIPVSLSPTETWPPAATRRAGKNGEVIYQPGVGQISRKPNKYSKIWAGELYVEPVRQ